jgi:CRISPR/Cas system-associated exonuclease Cas4 (RecB family)
MPFELNFQTKNDFKVLINGRIDLIWNDHGTKKIIDLKTPNSDVNSTNYKFQIELYLYAYNLLNSDQIQSGYVLNVRNDQISDEIIDNTDTEINIQTNIEKLLDAIRLHQFNKNTENCEHCLFNHICKNK